LELIGFLVIFPLIAAVLLWIIRDQRAREIVVYVSSTIIILASLLLAVQHLFAASVYYRFHSEIITYIALVVDIAISVAVIAYAVKYRKWLAFVLAAVQVLLTIFFEFFIAPKVSIETTLYIDTFSTIMALIIGIIGSGISIYALGYMKDFCVHDCGSGKRCNDFFAIMYVFLSAMFCIVFCNDLAWLFCAWEVTTISSFLLIGFTRTEEAINNAFRQIVMNMLGGIAFIVALILLGNFSGVLELDKVVAFGANGFLSFPICLLCFAAMTKCAQMPFHSWLLGAMVAPTPTSALLHSSTMVKAGVFMLVKLAPTLGMNVNGFMVMMVGGITFILCAAMAISQSNAKRVLAYSTISNLGLITLCAGIGTAEGVWAAIFLIIFHAAAKSLLFLCVGTAEHHIGSRDIESMDDLFVRMPRLARFMAIGIMGMFIAPFGMLISKWAAMVSVIDTGNLALIIILCFGSALTFVFWAKWLGKITAIASGQSDVEKSVHYSEWIAMGIMLVILLFCCVAFPWISQYVVLPYLDSQWYIAYTDVSFDNLLIMAVIVAVIIISFIGFFGKSSKRHVDVYLSGVGTDFETRSFTNAMGAPIEATQRNLYLEGWFGEKLLDMPGNIICAILFVGGLALSLVGIGTVM
jgi:ech hydrogenase subunit A